MKNRRKPLTVGKKITYIVLAVALVCALAYLAYYLVHFTFYDEYRNYLSTYEYEPGTELTQPAEKVTIKGNKNYKRIAQTEVLELYLNQKNSDIAVLDKRTGEITYGIPQNSDSDPVANKSNKNYLKSHLIVEYFNSARTKGTYDSFTMAVDRDQVRYEGIENGVRVIYELGDFSDSIGRVTTYLSQEKYEEIMAALPEKEAEAFARYYTDKSDVAGMRQILKAAQSKKATRKTIDDMLASVGFTEEDCMEQMALAGATISIPISFTIPLEYRLVDDHLDVSIPVCGIEEKGGASVYRIQVLNYFGAQDSSTDGYIVVPNGDGSIIRFNNGKIGAVGTYSQFVYGIDMLAADYTQVEYYNDASMGLFGLCTDKSTILSTIEDGSAFAYVTAGVSGKINSYNYVNASFVIRGSETLEMFGTTGNEASLPIVEPSPYDSNLKLRYSFLDEDHKGYSGMAKYMRDRLISEGVLEEKTGNGDIKLYYDVISGVEMTEFFLGKQYMGLTEMTTFDQASQMVKTFGDMGISNQVMNLQGWFNGGYYHDVADRIRIARSLGGKKGLEKLNETLREEGGTLYADVAFQKVSYDSKHFNYQTESSKYYGSGFVAAFGQVNPVTLRSTASLGYRETMYNLISPKFLVRYVDLFTRKFDSYDVDGISLRDLGTSLHSDKKRSNQIHREEALDVVTAMLGKVEDSGKKVMINKANDYAWGYADDIINLPLNDNDYIIVDANIPLYEMIVHGCIDYSGAPYNLTNASNLREQILTMVEYGAAPHFVFTWEEATKMKYSGMNTEYATTFASWVDEAVEVYNEVNSALSKVSGERMLQHEILDNGLRKVVYSNGVTIYINYSNQELTDSGVTVPALEFAVQ